jgi:hypothetical protein
VSQAAVHHPSSYGYSGQVGFPATVTGGSTATFDFRSLLPGAHTVTWAGGAPATNAITVAANGTASQAHTYPAGPGTYKMFVVEDATGRRVAQRTIVLPYAGGAGFAPMSMESAQGGGDGEGEQMMMMSAPPEPEPEIQVGYDPGAHTVQEVEDFVNENPDQRDDILAAEQAGKDRVTLVSWLENFTTGE